MLTKETFEEEVLKSDKPVLIRFYLEEGCGFCTQYAPVFEAFAKSHPEIKCLSVARKNTKEPMGEIEIEHGIEKYPTTVAYDKGEKINSVLGMQTASQLVELTKTIQNISDAELTGSILDFNIEKAKKTKELFEISSALETMAAEMNRRNEKKIKESKEPSISTSDEVDFGAPQDKNIEVTPMPIKKK